MKRLLFAVLPGDARLPEGLPPGLDGQPLRLLREGRVAAACAPAATAIADVPRLLAYATVVEALFAAGDLLPLRHGCLLAEDGVRELLRNRQEDFLAGLAAVAGCLEMGMRLFPAGASGAAPAAPTEVATTGAGFLAARRTQFAARDRCREEAVQLRRELDGRFGPVVRGVEVEPPRHTGEPFAAHFLVRRTDRERFQATFQAYQAEGEKRAILTGPWPPYNFAARA